MVFDIMNEMFENLNNYFHHFHHISKSNHDLEWEIFNLCLNMQLQTTVDFKCVKNELRKLYIFLLLFKPFSLRLCIHFLMIPTYV